MKSVRDMPRTNLRRVRKCRGPRGLILTATVTACLVLSACGDPSDERTREHCGAGAACAEIPLQTECVQSGPAKVCAFQYDRYVRVSATGISPSTQVSLSSNGEAPVLHDINPDGSLAGFVAIPSAAPSRSEIQVSGVAGDGAALSGTITLG